MVLLTLSTSISLEVSTTVNFLALATPPPPSSSHHVLVFDRSTGKVFLSTLRQSFPEAVTHFLWQDSFLACCLTKEKKFEYSLCIGSI